MPMFTAFFCCFLLVKMSMLTKLKEKHKKCRKYSENIL